MYRLLTFGIVILAVLITVILSSILANIIRRKYPEIYSEYGRPNPIIPSPSSLNFIGEFVIGGVYKSELRKEDQKYASRVRWSALITFSALIIDLYMVFS